MADSGNGPPTLTEITRRLQRVEDKLDERTATVDMLRSTERLFEARELTHAAASQALEARVARLEAANSRLVNLVIGSFLLLLINIVVLVLSISSQGGG